MTEPKSASPSGPAPAQEFPETFGVPPDLLKILVCPMAHAELRLENGYLICTRCGPKFRIEDGIPIMLIDEAQLPEGVSRIEDLPCWPEVEKREAPPEGK